MKAMARGTGRSGATVIRGRSRPFPHEAGRPRRRYAWSFLSWAAIGAKS